MSNHKKAVHIYVHDFSPIRDSLFITCSEPEKPLTADWVKFDDFRSYIERQKGTFSQSGYKVKVGVR